MAKDAWLRVVTITASDLASGDWTSREHNPIAKAIARVLRPGVTVYVDVGREEYFLSHGAQRQWFGLPAEFLPYANRVADGELNEEFQAAMRFPPWALLTGRSRRKQEHQGGQET
jgi:hypothetical protein